MLLKNMCIFPHNKSHQSIGCYTLVFAKPLRSIPFAREHLINILKVRRDIRLIY